MCYCTKNESFTSRDNPKYRANVNRLADLFAANRHSPLDDAAWLMEFVAVTQGAEHLKIASRHLNVIQLYGLDVMLFFITVLVLALKLIVMLPLAFRRSLYRAKSSTIEKVKKS